MTGIPSNWAPSLFRIIFKPLLNGRTKLIICALLFRISSNNIDTWILVRHIWIHNVNIARSLFPEATGLNPEIRLRHYTIATTSLAVDPLIWIISSPCQINYRVLVVHSSKVVSRRIWLISVSLHYIIHILIHWTINTNDMDIHE